MKNNILFIILSFSLLSCQHKGDSTKNSTIETIPVFSNYTAELPFSAFVDTIELIPLETTEDNLIGEITRVIFNDGKYYIRSTNGMQNPKLFVFNENGKSAADDCAPVFKEIAENITYITDQPSH